MNNTAVKIQENQRQHSSTRPHVKRKRKLKIRFTLGEKLIFVSFLLFALYAAIHIVSNQVAIYQMNKEIQQLEDTIQEQKKHNNDLYVEVQQLSTYERILQKAKELGLSLNENNVKVVQE
ncbi:cell division protein FtsL [Thermaerobacillus caldiproteolyticus]|uniref:cell division protein FtsL n=1 Tax=Thermaerobacillus caldiproteolyticus TaxID=247480 RepID=UPI00188AA79E|nr:cell division protein FtsL [Anoxybacillus caldiproteolyticus]QPA31955.1 cell division protein FtsL [Anoxybacillus caldiproteolyticus]